MCNCAAGTCVCGTIVNGVRQDCGCSPVSGESRHPVARYLDTYGPLLFVILGIDVAAIEAAATLRTELSLFVSLFFVVFGVLQLKNIREYVPSLARYNGLVGRFPAYGYSLPFIQLLLAVLFGYNALARMPGGFNPAYLSAATALHGSPLLWSGCLLTALIFLIDAAYVVRSLRRGQRPTCACLGLVLAVPLSPLTVIEDLLMVSASLALLLLR